MNPHNTWIVFSFSPMINVGTYYFFWKLQRQKKKTLETFMDYSIISKWYIEMYVFIDENVKPCLDFFVIKESPTACTLIDCNLYVKENSLVQQISFLWKLKFKYWFPALKIEQNGMAPFQRQYYILTLCIYFCYLPNLLINCNDSIL